MAKVRNRKPRPPPPHTHRMIGFHRPFGMVRAEVIVHTLRGLGMWGMWLNATDIICREADKDAALNAAKSLGLEYRWDKPLTYTREPPLPPLEEV